jgi:small-conductance mechanosensitive channel
VFDTARAIWDTTLFSIAGDPIHVGQLVLVLLVLVLGYIAGKILERTIEKRLTQIGVRTTAVQAIKRISFYTLLVLVFMIALGLLNIPLGAFAFVSGAVAIGVGFGAQNVINNFLSGWILLAEQPVRIGDFIELDSHMGVVERIGNRSTRIRRVDGVHLLIPNSQMLERVVVNWTLVDRDIRTQLSVGVAYGSPIRKVKELVEQAVNEQVEIIDSHPPLVVLNDFGDNAIVFETFFWCRVGGERELRQIRSAVRFRIAELFEENDITIAFPQRDVHLDSKEPMRVELVDGGKSPRKS